MTTPHLRQFGVAAVLLITTVAGCSGGSAPTLSDAQGNPADDSGAPDGTGSDGTRYGAAGSPNAGYHLGTRGASGDIFQGCTAVPGGEGGQIGTICSAFLVPDGVKLVSIGSGVEGVDVGGPDDAIWSIPRS